MPTEPILHVDLNPDPDLPLRILRVYRANCDVVRGTTDAAQQARQAARAQILDRAIGALERGAKVSQGMGQARRRGRLLGRPARLNKLVPVIRKALRDGKTGAEICLRLASFKNPPSQAWVYQQITKLKSAK